MRQKALYKFFIAILTFAFKIGKISLRKETVSGVDKIKTTYTIERVSSNDTLDWKTVLKKPVKILDGIRIALVFAFSPAYVLLDGDGDGIKSLLNRLYLAGFWIQYYTNGQVRVLYRNNFRYVCLTDGTVSKTLDTVPGWTLSKQVKYNFYCFSNSGTRSQAAVFSSLGYKKCFKALNKTLYGALQIAFQLFVGKVFGDSLNALGKIASRLGLGLAPMKKVCRIDNYCIYNSTLESRHKNADGSRDQIADGWSAGDGDHYSEKCGFHNSEFVGSGWQVRPFATKTFMTLHSAFVYKVLIEGIEAIIAIKRAEIKAAIKAEKDPIKIAKLKKQLKSESLTFVGDPDKCECIFDQNAIKMPFRHTSGDMRVLAVAKNSRSKCSKQLFKCFIKAALDKGCYKEAMNVANKLMALTLKNIKAVHFNPASQIITEEQAEKDLAGNYINNILTTCVPELIHEIPGLYQSSVKQYYDKVTQVIDGCNFELESYTERMMPDISTFIAGWKIDGILKSDEIYVNRPNIGRVAIIKYPSTLNIEYKSSKNVSLQTIRQRLNKLMEDGTITDRENQAIYMYFKELDPAIIVIPADIRICSMLAGSDFDYDSCIIIVETVGRPEEEMTELQVLTNEFVDIMFRTEETYVEIVH